MRATPFEPLQSISEISLESDHLFLKIENVDRGQPYQICYIYRMEKLCINYYNYVCGKITMELLSLCRL